jgi:hypothetical protein
MNGVLAKPFTKSGMQKIVENHLSYLLKGYDPSTQQESGSGYVVGGAGYMNPPSNLNTPGGTAFKFETTPTPPATGATWSPGQMPQQSPLTRPGPRFSFSIPILSRPFWSCNCDGPHSSHCHPLPPCDGPPIRPPYPQPVKLCSPWT